LVLAATNRPDAIDEALLRSGRFDEVVEIPNPDVDSRLEILRVHTRNKPLAPGVDLAKLAILTEGMSGAELEAACRQAAMSAVRRMVDHKDQSDCCISQRDLILAINEILAKDGKGPIADARPRVLVVDDEKDILRLICKVLTTYGYEGVGLERPTQAIERLQSEYFDVAVLDVHLPEKDGVKLMKDIKVIQPHVGIIMVTGDTDVHFAVESLKAGASDYLLKPFDLNALMASIQKAVQDARKQRGAPLPVVEARPTIADTPSAQQ
jgi:SpoVK/Ycf46/Vps4 family AAA+-type ATPase